MPESAFLDDLAWRGLVQDCTGLAELTDHLASGSRRFYIGFDPTAPSLTVGNLLPVLLLIRGGRHGHHPVAVLGGGTGAIGDPSGKSAERNLLDRTTLLENLNAQRDQLLAIFERAGVEVELVDNAEWLEEADLIPFLRDIGKHFSVGEMIRRDTVRRRLEAREATLSFTEFSYSLLQGYDFLQLNQRYGVTLQLGGSDQWGNIVAGVDLVRKVARQTVHGLTCPLLLRSDGTKFGKSEQGAVWLAADRTSPYALYQFLLNHSDEDAARMARFLSLAGRAELDQLFADHSVAPEMHLLQQRLAGELTALLHGAEVAEAVAAASRALFSGEVKSLGPRDLEELSREIPAIDIDTARLDRDGWALDEACVELGLATSRRQAREFLANGAIYINGQPSGSRTRVQPSDLLAGAAILFRRGKKSWAMARLTESTPP